MDTDTHSTMPFKVWVQAEARLWKILEGNSIVKKNDSVLFYKFGEWFYDYYVEHKEFPTYSQAIEWLGY